MLTGEEDGVPCPRRVPGTSVCSFLVGVPWRAVRTETALVPVVLAWEFALVIPQVPGLT